MCVSFRASFGSILAVAGRCGGHIRLPRPCELLNAMVIAHFGCILGCFRWFLGRVFEPEFSDLGWAWGGRFWAKKTTTSTNTLHRQEIVGFPPEGSYCKPLGSKPLLSRVSGGRWILVQRHNHLNEHARSTGNCWIFPQRARIASRWAPNPFF